MAQFGDHLTKESVHALHNAFIEGVLQLERTDKGDIGLTQATYDEVGIPLIRWIHHRLWTNSEPNHSNLSGYPRVSNLAIQGILNDEGVTYAGKEPYGRTTRLAADVGRVLQHAGLAFQHKRRWYLRPWDESKLEWITGGKFRKIDPREEKRIEEEADKPVETRTDLRSIKLPDDSPTSIRDFVQRFIPAALKVQEQRDEARRLAQKYHAELTSALEQLDNLQAELEGKAEAEEWKGISGLVAEVMNASS